MLIPHPLRPSLGVRGIECIIPAGEGGAYEITVDANETFGTVERAIDVGKKLKACPLVHCLESPVTQSDIEGYRQIRAALDLPLAHHIGAPDAIDALHSGVYDYFILGTTVAALQRDAHICGARDRPFWMQLGGDGTDISTLFMMHLAAATPNATKGRIEEPILRKTTPQERQISFVQTPSDLPIILEILCDRDHPKALRHCLLLHR